MDNTSTTPIEIQTARISLGLCPTCGIQTQQHNDKGILVPVTNMAVRNLRCLLCNPLSELEPIQLINDKFPENNVDYYIILKDTHNNEQVTTVGVFIDHSLCLW